MRSLSLSSCCRLLMTSLECCLRHDGWLWRTSHMQRHKPPAKKKTRATRFRAKHHFLTVFLDGGVKGTEFAMPFSRWGGPRFFSQNRRLFICNVWFEHLEEIQEAAIQIPFPLHINMSYPFPATIPKKCCYSPNLKSYRRHIISPHLVFTMSPKKGKTLSRFCSATGAVSLSFYIRYTGLH